MAKKIKVFIDEELCVGCGMCASLCPEVFEIKEGKSHVKEGVSLEKNENCIEKAIENCPVEAISKKS
ncbi:MAG: ferredoxin [Candidatus Paceibacterota bacterium]